MLKPLFFFFFFSLWECLAETPDNFPPARSISQGGWPHQVPLPAWPVPGLLGGGENGAGKGGRSPLLSVCSSFPQSPTTRFCSRPRWWWPGLEDRGQGCGSRLRGCFGSHCIPKAPQCLGSPGVSPGDGGQWLGTPQLAGDLWGLCGGCLRSSLRAEASISWPSPERQTGCRTGGTGPGAMSLPCQEPHHPTFIADHIIRFSLAANSSPPPPALLSQLFLFIALDLFHACIVSAVKSFPEGYKVRGFGFCSPPPPSFYF